MGERGGGGGSDGQVGGALWSPWQQLWYVCVCVFMFRVPTIVVVGGGVVCDGGGCYREPASHR